MSNIPNLSPSLTVVRHLLMENLTSSSASVWIINERNSTPVNIDIPQPSVRIMWYRFLLIIIIFITAVGNLLVCLAIARERKLQNTTNYFLMSLAIADCLVAILVMPIGMVSEVLGYFPLPHYACIAFTTIDVLCCTSSIWHMSTMSMDRYFTIRFPFRYGRNKTRRIMLLKIVAVWAISAAISSPIFVLGIVDKRNVLVNDVCAPNNSAFKIYGSIFAFYIPFIIMITTYALTMRSLRNVLVNKKKYDRERRRKQTFRPLAQIINQYAEIAQGIRRTSSTKKQTLPIITTTNNNNHMNSISNKTPYTIITTTSTSPTDSRTQFFSINNTNVNLQRENNSINLTNGTQINDELMHHNSQHLTISYIKPSGSKKRRYQHQQTLAMNTTMNRTKNNEDMSTVYEITEYSKSTSSSYDVSAILGNNVKRRSIVNNELQPLKVIDNIEPSQNSNPTISVINDIAPLEEEVSSASDMDSGTDVHDSLYVQITSSSLSQPASLSHSNESIFLTIPWQYCIYIIQYIVQYYIFCFPYRLNLLSIDHPSNINKKSLKFNRSTSISSIYIKPVENHRSVATQTNSFLPSDFPYTHSTTVNENSISNSPKRRKFPFNRPILPSSSLLTNFFRPSPTTPIRLSESSTKSTVSYGQRSSVASSLNQPRQPYSPGGIFRRLESEAEPVLSTERRSRTSTSSSYLLHTTHRQRSHTSSNYHKPLRRHQCQSQSSYFTGNSFKSPRQFSSTTNTNSSDSSSFINRYHSKFLTTVSQQQQQRVRVEDIVAANERKALRVLMIIFCVFITLWTPFFICTFISAVCEQCRARLSSNVWFSITWLGYSSSMANPFIYTIFSDVFRRAFINIIFCRSNDLLISRQLSTKSSNPKGGTHQYKNERFSYRKNLNHDVSGTSTPTLLHYPIPKGESDATIYINRYGSDAFR